MRWASFSLKVIDRSIYLRSRSTQFKSKLLAILWIDKAGPFVAADDRKGLRFSADRPRPDSTLPILHRSPEVPRHRIQNPQRG